MIDPSRPFSSRAASRGTEAATSQRELGRLLERARDERFRLLKMLQETRGAVAERGAAARPVEVAVPSAPAQVAPVGSAVDREQLQTLIGKMSAIDQKLEEKLARLESLSSAKLDAAEAHANQSVHVLRQAEDARRMAEEAANHAAKTLAALRSAVQMAENLPERVIGQLERFDLYLGEAVEDSRAALISAADAGRADAVAELSQQLRDAEDSVAAGLVSQFDELAEAMQQRADEVASTTQRAADQALAGVRRRLIEAMAHAHDTQEAFGRRLEQHQELHRQKLDALAVDADEQMLLRARQLDERFTGMTQLFERQTQVILGEMRSKADQLLSEMSEQVLRLAREVTEKGESEDRQAA